MSLPSWNKAAFIEKASKGMFAARAARTDVYKNNCEIFKEGGYVTDSGETVSLDPSGMLERTAVYSETLPVPEVKPLDTPTATGVANRDCIGLGRELQERGYNPVILNLADAYMACGWYYKGSKAQEESLCRQSTLSMSLYQYYSQAHCDNSGIEFKEKLYPLDLNHGAIYSPEVTVFRKGPKDCYELMDKPYQTAFISCAALDFNEKHGKNLEYQTVDGGFTPEGRLIMLNKIRTIYTVALANGHDSMVLGAFGCGAFRLRPDLVAGMFRDVLCEPAFKDRFRLVCFAILEGDGDTGLHGKFAPFYKVFGSLNLSNPKASMIPAEELPDYKEGQHMFNLERFIKAQENCDSYMTALKEIKDGYKRTHWIWYIFPQAKGLGHSGYSNFYGISSLLEAKAYLENETLSVRLQEAVMAMATHAGNLTAEEVLGHTDSRKFRSCLTLFDMVKPDDIYSECLDMFFEGKRCRRTLELFSEEIANYLGQNV